MALVVFMRAVNVAGHQTFRPSKLASNLTGLDVVNVGAAGTLVVRGKVTEAGLRKAIQANLEFLPEMMISSAGEILGLLSEKTFKGPSTGMQAYLTVMASRPQSIPALPISLPETGEWQTRVIAVSGRYALSHRRIGGKVQYYPNEIIEKRFKVAATTRSWTTFIKICEILEEQPSRD